MTDVGAAPAEVSSHGGLRDIVVAVLAPVAVAAVSWVLWRISDTLLYVGLLDRAQFAWGVVIPIWLAVPVVAAFLWRRLTRPHAIEAAVALNVVIGAVAAWLLWRATTAIDCQFGPAYGPEARAP